MPPKGDADTGPGPGQLDIHLERRDTRALAPGALVRFQVISRSFRPTHNYRWLLYTDGRWFLARHSPYIVDPDAPFDTELPRRPTRRLAQALVREVLGQLEAADFLNQAPYQADERTEDGSFYVITARLGEQVHEVIYNGVYSPLIEYLEQFTYAHE